MKSAKRMALVPEEMLNMFERKQRLETSPVTSDIMRSDMRMSEIFDRADLTDDEKQKLYNMNMQRLMELRQQKNTHVPAVWLAPVKEEPDAFKLRRLTLARLTLTWWTFYPRVCSKELQPSWLV
jgi:hypothetical protein